MNAESKSHRTQIIIAVIGLIGVLGGALLANWGAIFGSKDSNSKKVTTSEIKWQQQASYQGDCKARPTGTICMRFEDGYIWLLKGSLLSSDKRHSGEQNIAIAITSSGRYEHMLYTNNVRKVY